MDSAQTSDGIISFQNEVQLTKSQPKFREFRA